MKIKLLNFKCYENKEYEIPTNGLVLLSGPSGIGKSSFLQAINFALYGTGTKLIMFGKSNCKVELEFDNIKIIRTKHPNNLLVDDKYKDEAGQSIINTKFGKSFDIIGYMAQDTFNSFAFMRPLEKLNFVEKIALNDIDLDKIKSKCKNTIRKYNEDLIHTTSQLEMVENVLKDKEKPQEIKFPLKCAKKNIEICIKNEKIKFRNTLKLLSKIEKSLNNLSIEKHELELLYKEINIKSDRISVLENEIKVLSDEKKNVVFIGDEKLTEYEEQLKSVMKIRELDTLVKTYNEDKQRLEEMKQHEIDDIQKNIKHIDSSLWKEYTPEEVVSIVKDLKNVLKDRYKLNELINSLNVYKIDEKKLLQTEIELKQEKIHMREQNDILNNLKEQQITYQCPNCDINLRFEDNCLHFASIDTMTNDNVNIETIEKSINNIAKSIQEKETYIQKCSYNLKIYKETQQKIQNIETLYEESIPQIKEIETDLEYMNKYKNSNIEFEKQIKTFKQKLEDGEFSALYTDFMKKLKIKKKRIQTLKTDIKNTDINEDELHSIIYTERNNKQILEKNNIEYNKKTEECKTIISRIDSIKQSHNDKYKKIRKMSTIISLITKRTNEKLELESKKSKHSENLKKIEIYEEYLEKNTEYDSWLKKSIELLEQEKELRKEYAAAVQLKETITIAESLAITNIITSINTYTQTYLDKFFTENPIVIQLQTFKEYKNKIKPQIHLQIEYKGMSDISIDTLSGGEKARVVLAFTLALSEMYNVPLIMLDEATSSLDSELTGEIIENIKDCIKNKMVIMVAHQIHTNAQFDHIIQF
jgi:DNA repair exonuclease SbcCD ATPase subunit